MSNVNVIGLKELEAKINTLAPEVLEEIDIEVQDAAKLWEQLAKEAAPTRFGFLKGSILGSKLSFLNAEVVSPKFYSPYQEWGTGDNVSIPDELVAYAIQFKGHKKVKGNKPHPFFFIQRPQVEAFLFDHINKILNTEH